MIKQHKFEGISLELSDNGEGFDVLCGEEDFTFYLPKGDLLSLIQNAVPEDLLQHSKETSGMHSIDCSLRVQSGSQPQSQFVWTGRANIASCYAGKSFSITARRKALLRSDSGQELDATTRQETSAMLRRQRPVKSLSDNLSILAAMEPPVQLCGSNRFAYDMAVIADLLAPKLFPAGSQTGVIIISGSTGSGKSKLATGLVARYLSGLQTSSRRPHLVTIEDPVENLLVRSPKTHNENRDRGLDYTPRTLGVDTPSLASALRDAKRMTPAAVYIGETRNSREWRDVIDFASSGHLVITTTHAGSLVQTLQSLFKALNANTPVDRGNVAKCLIGAVHLRTIEAAVGDKRCLVCAPALWLRSNGGKDRLISDGLASVVPDNPIGTSVSNSAKACLGRSWFIRAIQARLVGRLKTSTFTEAEVQEHNNALASISWIWNPVYIQAAKQDLADI